MENIIYGEIKNNKISELIDLNDKAVVHPLIKYYKNGFFELELNVPKFVKKK